MTLGISSVGTVAVGVLADSPSGGGGTTYTKSLAGSLTASGVAPKKLPGVSKAGSVAISGSLTVRLAIGQLLSGSLTASGALRRRISRRLTGSLTAASVLRRKVSSLLSGSLTVAAGLARKPRKRLAGTLTPSGALARGLKLPKALAGALTAAGSAAGNKLIFTTTIATQGAKALYSMLSRR